MFIDSRYRPATVYLFWSMVFAFLAGLVAISAASTVPVGVGVFIEALVAIGFAFKAGRISAGQ